MKKVCAFLWLAVSVLLSDVGVAAEIRGLVASQRQPFLGIVDIAVTLEGSSDEVSSATCMFLAKNAETGDDITVLDLMEKEMTRQSEDVWIRNFVWYAGNDISAVKVEDIALSVAVDFSQRGVQLWKDGPYWDEFNVGASRPEEWGCYFWWGDTVGYKIKACDENIGLSGHGRVNIIAVDGSGKNFSFDAENCLTYGKTLEELRSAGYVDADCNLLPNHDAATAHLGTPWRLPTGDELIALERECTAERSEENGVGGIRIRGKGEFASRSIFIPWAGMVSGEYYYDPIYCHCWSATVSPRTSDQRTWSLRAYDTIGRIEVTRNGGYSVRAVRDYGMVSADALARKATTHLSVDCRRIPEIVKVDARQRQLWGDTVDIFLTLRGDTDIAGGVDYLFAATNIVTGAAIAIQHIVDSGIEVLASNEIVRKYTWNARADVGEVKINELMLFAWVNGKMLADGVQLWEDGPFWAKSNVGANSSEDSGLYFYWGDIVGYRPVPASLTSNNIRADVAWISNDDLQQEMSPFSMDLCPTEGRVLSALQADGYVDSAGNLVALYDAATAHCGRPWRIPTHDEYRLLAENCTIMWTMRNGAYGCLVSGKGLFKSKSIFLPAVGYGVGFNLWVSGLAGASSEGCYWTSTAYGSGSTSSGELFFNDGIFSGYSNRCSSRYLGMPIRHVRGAETNGMTLSPQGKQIMLSLDCRKPPEITSVSIHHQTPRSDLVDIVIELRGELDAVQQVLCEFRTVDADCGIGLPLVHLRQDGNDSGSAMSWTRHYIWDAKADLGERRIEDLRMSVSIIGIADGLSIDSAETHAVVDCRPLPKISRVTAQQRYPWNGMVDISYTLTGDVPSYCKDERQAPSLKVSAVDRESGKTYSASRISGDTAFTDGVHKIVWDLDAEGLAIKSNDVVFNVECETVEGSVERYCVIDLSGGPEATSYPISYLEDVPRGGFNTDEYKTTKLVLKRIEPGAFIMGDDQTDQSHRVTLTKPFYMGIFEVTQKQWFLVMGANPAKLYGVGDSYPQYNVSYSMIRGSVEGAKWPLSGSVDAASFLGKLQTRTGLAFDLPTEAQWEYACRAETMTAYYWGAMASSGYAWFGDNAGGVVHPVGEKNPNGYGLYDMCGNVEEWTLDWKGYTLPYGIDPVGVFSGDCRVLRGGDWLLNAVGSSWRNYNFPSNTINSLGYNDDGLRISLTLP